MTPEPGDETVEAELVGFVECGNERVSLLGVRRQSRAIDGEKGVRSSECRALVAVDKGMILREALPQRCRFLNQVGVITGLRPEEGGFEEIASFW